jgi:WD40 repeat protein
VRIWNLKNGNTTRTTPAQLGEVLALCSTNQGTVAAAGSEGLCRVWKRDGNPQCATQSIGEWIYAIQFDWTGKRLFAGDWRGRVHVFDAQSGKALPGFQVE